MLHTTTATIAGILQSDVHPHAGEHVNINNGLNSVLCMYGPRERTKQKMSEKYAISIVALAALLTKRSA